jgi:hypothetical protein
MMGQRASVEIKSVLRLQAEILRLWGTVSHSLAPNNSNTPTLQSDYAFSSKTKPTRAWGTRVLAAANGRGCQRSDRDGAG